MNKIIFALPGLLIAALMGPLAMAQTTSHREVSSTVSSDTQPESPMDADLADRVRRSVVCDRDLSSYAAKINIVANYGIVHLSGLVQNEGEKAQIAFKAFHSGPLKSGCGRPSVVTALMAAMRFFVSG